MIFTLIGMPGSGKSSIGKAVSKKLAMTCIDGDDLIEKKAGKKLWLLVNELGVEGFKALEEKVLSEFDEDGCILATGGSAVYSDLAMKHLKSKGKVVYLKVSLEIIKERLGDFSKRGVVLRKGQTIDDLYNERCSLYEKYADITIDCSGNAFSKYQSELIKIIQNET